MRHKMNLALFLALAVSIVEAQWVQIVKPSSYVSPKIFSMVAKDSNIFAAFEHYVGRTSDNGATWTYSNPGVSGNATVLSLAVTDSLLFAGTVMDGLFQSTNNGVTFVHTGLTIGYISSIVVLEKTIIATSWVTRPYRSTDNGNTWTPIADSNFTGTTIAVSGNVLFAGTKKGVYQSKDSGTTWNKVYLEPANIIGATAYAIFSGKPDSGILRSIDNGNTWALTGGHPAHPGDFTAVGNRLFLGNGEGIYQSLDTGTSWQTINTGLIEYNVTTTAGPSTYYKVSKIVANNGYLFAGVTGDGIWRRSLSEVVSIEHQNLENNFNQDFGFTTKLGGTIRSGEKMEFTIAHRSSITLELFSSNGERKSTLVKTVLSPGTHDIQFEGEGITEGVFFLRLKVAEKAITKRIIFIK